MMSDRHIARKFRRRKLQRFSHISSSEEPLGQPKKKRRSSSTESPEDKKGKGNSTSIQIFPPELLYYIISFLPVKDVVALSQTCRYFHEVCDSEGVWQRICRRLSPRLRDENSGGSRPWKRSAILNYTKGLYFQMFSGRRHFVSKTVAPLLSHGYQKFLPTKDHVFILDYNGTLFFLKNALVSSNMGHIQWRRACRYMVLCRSAKDVRAKEEETLGLQQALSSLLPPPSWGRSGVECPALSER
ncbi:hypothetical protein JD844_000718 [Phrynosoma platyrhinos]|uniref:F-box domain-containing protein n=1 Tax=Phrynosoma platyrhinos TaxID=52577 RepID=A0ABQ7T9B2_PHRPL|nr:hypothetical protein JD844_000718 [Phrynosoma platyrhinos]